MGEEQNKAEGGEKQRRGSRETWRGSKTPSPPPNACAHRGRTPGGFWDTYTTGGCEETHTLSGRQGVALAWQLLSSSGVTFLSEKPKHQPQKWFLAHLPSTSPTSTQQETGSRKGWRATEQRQGGSLARILCPQQRNKFRSSIPAQQLGQRVPELKSKEGTRAWWPGRSTAQCTHVGAAWVVRAGQKTCCFPSGRCTSQEPEDRGHVAVLPNLGLLLSGYFESWSSLAFCRIWQTSVMG